MVWGLREWSGTRLEPGLALPSPNCSRAPRIKPFLVWLRPKIQKNSPKQVWPKGVPLSAAVPICALFSPFEAEMLSGLWVNTTRGEVCSFWRRRRRRKRPASGRLAGGKDCPPFRLHTPFYKSKSSFAITVGRGSLTSVPTQPLKWEAVNRCGCPRDLRMRRRGFEKIKSGVGVWTEAGSPTPMAPGLPFHVPSYPFHHGAATWLILPVTYACLKD